MGFFFSSELRLSLFWFAQNFIGFFLSPLLAQDYALRFFGNGTGDIDRVKIRIDQPGNPLNVGQNFTIEFRLRGILADNPSGGNVQDGAHDDWTLGHILIDRDIFGSGDYGDFGISLVGGRIAFGVNNGSQSYTLVGSRFVLDGSWHSVAVTRSISGSLAIYVDGILDDQANSSVTGDLSYRIGRSTSWPNDPYLILGAEKHDYDPSQYPSFRGLLDELRVSSIVRYTSSYVPLSRLSDDSHTVALYHFDEGSGTFLRNAAALSGALADGTLRVGGNPAGPVWELVGGSTVLQETRQRADVSIYPNPAKSLCWIESSAPELTAFDSIGRRWRKVEPGCIDISDWPPGFYVLQGRDGSTPLLILP
ncbi:MAG: LamG domain-containing protein [Bacteroidia bacterium]|nr:LamG domain-containing protein [Bacteroidia bacterium]